MINTVEQTSNRAQGYDFSDYDALYKEASTKAVQNAKIKAERVAKIAGTNLTEIVSFRVDRPQRIKRVGQQAMIISNHQNRDAPAGSAIGFADQVVVTGRRSVQPAPAPQPVVSFQGASTSSYTAGQYRPGELPPGNALPGETYTRINDGFGDRWVPSSNTNANNALKMSLQAGKRTITISAYLGYLYETPIDGSVVPIKVN